VCDQKNSELLRYVLGINELIGVETERLRSLSYRIRLLAKIRRWKPDAIIVSNPQKYWHAMAFLSGAKVRIGYSRKWSFFLNQTLPDTKDESLKHEVDYNLDLVRPLCPKPWNRAIDLGLDTHPKHNAIRDRSGILPGKKIIAMHLTTSDIRKTWPLEKFKETARALLQKKRYQVILVGNERKDEIEELFWDLKSEYCVNLIGKTSWAELGIVLRHCGVLLTLDSGPLHLAWMQGIPTVCLYMREAPGSNPTRWGAYPNFSPHIAIHKSADQIMPPEVLAALDQCFAEEAV
jgi:ADP-heptose:LPS heptosyltransferase